MKQTSMFDKKEEVTVTEPATNERPNLEVFLNTRGAIVLTAKLERETIEMTPEDCVRIVQEIRHALEQMEIWARQSLDEIDDGPDDMPSYVEPEANK